MCRPAPRRYSWGGVERTGAVQGDFDNRWHRTALAGEPQAVARLAEAGIGPLYRFCLARVGGNHHLCEEVVQETLLQAIRRLKTYEPDRSLVAIGA